MFARRATSATFLTGALLAGVMGLAPARAAAPPPTIAVFGFSLDNTSPAESTPDELARTARLGPTMAAMLAKSGDFQPVDTAPVAGAMKDLPDFENCDDCVTALARQLHATLAAYGWVQKVSNLILNINVVVEDVKTGKMIRGGSVDIRGNTDESWTRGLDFLLQEHVLPR